MRDGLRAVAPGPHVTIQDAGRRGWRRFGVSCSGAMDLLALSTANVLVGNPPETAALEFAQYGGTWEVAVSSCRIAVTGGGFTLTAGGEELEPWQSHTLQQGEILTIKRAPDTVWGYLAVAGGFAIAPQLGSCATHLRSGLGALGGRLVSEGDMVPLQADRAPSGGERLVRPPRRSSGTIRVVLGPQADFFSSETIAAFLASTYHVTHRGDRMGSWLSGPHIRHERNYNVLSDGLVPGCIQVPGAGQPLVLLMDCQTIGGYPKLATIITADLPRFAQLRPGSPVTFAAIDVETAQRLYRDHHAYCSGFLQAVRDVEVACSRPFWLRA